MKEKGIMLHGEITEDVIGAAMAVLNKWRLEGGTAKPPVAQRPRS
jgi:hypothetical protein